MFPLPTIGVRPYTGMDKEIPHDLPFTVNDSLNFSDILYFKVQLFNGIGLQFGHISSLSGISQISDIYTAASSVSYSPYGPGSGPTALDIDLSTFKYGAGKNIVVVYQLADDADGLPLAGNFAAAFDTTVLSGMSYPDGVTNGQTADPALHCFSGDDFSSGIQTITGTSYSALKAIAIVCQTQNAPSASYSFVNFHYLTVNKTNLSVVPHSNDPRIKNNG